MVAENLLSSTMASTYHAPSDTIRYMGMVSRLEASGVAPERTLLTSLTVMPDRLSTDSRDSHPSR